MEEVLSTLTLEETRLFFPFLEKVNTLDGL